MRVKDVNMLSGSITRGLLAISIPVMIMNVTQSIFNVVDMTMLKTFDSGDGSVVGAVGVCSTLISVITGLAVGVSSGANVIIARKIGQKDPEATERAIHTAMAFSIAVGILISLIGITFADILLQWVNCPAALLPDASLYFRLYFAGVPILMIYNFSAAIFRSSGDSRRPMVFLILGGIMKVTCNFVLLSQFRLGVVSVAVATILSWSVSAFLIVRALVRNTGAVKLAPQKIRLHWIELSEILRIGVPAGMQQVLYSIANTIISAAANSFGTQATTGNSIANNFDNILYHIVAATSLAVMPYVSQNIGAKNPKRASQSIWKGCLITTSFGLFFGIMAAVFSEQLASLMSSDPLTIAYAQEKIILVCGTYFICGINDILGAALRGMGRPLPATICTFLFMCLLRFVWVEFIFPLAPSLGFLYLVWPIGWTLSIFTLLCILIPVIRKLSKSIPQSPACAEGIKS